MGRVGKQVPALCLAGRGCETGTGPRLSHRGPPTLPSLVRRGHPGALPLAFLPCAHTAGCQGMPQAEMTKPECGRGPAGHQHLPPCERLESPGGRCPSATDMRTVPTPP